MGKYRLISKHYIHDRILDEGTIVGDDTPFPLAEGGVTPEMVGLDESSQAEVDAVLDKQTKPLATAPQLGMLYLEPEVQSALIAAARGQQGGDPEKRHPLTTPLSEKGPMPNPKPDPIAPRRG